MSNDKDSIESSAYPLVFQAEASALNLLPLEVADENIHIRTMARALAGMQKEALIQYGPTGRLWRVVCDEGPWLNGTDLAPFPLAFFTAGLAASFMSAFLDEATNRGIRIDSARLGQDNFFTMEGSALRGTMTAEAQPVELTFSASGNASSTEFEEIALAAVRDRSPAERCLETALASAFTVQANNEQLPWSGEAAHRIAGLADPAILLKGLFPAASEQPDIIRKSDGPAKTATAKTAAGAVGLQASQKRLVHVHTDCVVRDDGLKSIGVQCIKPAGSRFEFLSDDSRAVGGQERAPSGLAYLSAGVAFCFMTQIGRYAQITKQDLKDYRIIQDTEFRLAAELEPDASAVETLVFLDTGESQDKSIQLVRMSEQTCYIHAAYRAPIKTVVRFRKL
jgi:uncharacterized OsmC-like protein